jgi:hypothetical protein
MQRRERKSAAHRALELMRILRVVPIDAVIHGTLTIIYGRRH